MPSECHPHTSTWAGSTRIKTQEEEKDVSPHLLNHGTYPGPQEEAEGEMEEWLTVGTLNPQP